MRIRLNERWLEREPAPLPGVVEEHRDAQTPGLYVRHIGPPVQEGETEADRRARSVMTFMWRRTVDRKRYLKNLGRRGPGFDLDAAQKAANKWNVRTAEGTIEEETARRKKIPTLSECYKAFKKEHSKNLTQRTIEGYDRLGDLFEGLETMKITNVKRADLVNLHLELGKTRERTANRVLNLISRLWEAAANEEIVKGRNPATGIPRYPERPRERVVTREEWSRLRSAIDELTKAETSNATEVQDVQDFLSILIFTGVRKSNALSMVWEDIDMEKSTWLIPKLKAKGKKKDIEVQLPSPVMEILQRRKTQGGDFVFPGIGKTGHMADPRKAWLRILKKAEIHGLTFHDLRRSSASLAHNRGDVPNTLIADSLGHSNVVSTNSYTWSNADAVRREMENTAQQILGYMGEGN